MIDVSISIISTNERDILRRCLDSIYLTAAKEISFEVIVLDNRSDDGTSEMLLSDYPQVRVIRNGSKKGFCENHNLIINKCTGKYILMLNSDVFFEQGFLSELVRTIGSDNKIGGVTGKLLAAVSDNSKRIIDTTGVLIFKNRRSRSRGQGEEDRGQYDIAEPIFASEGAALLCKREMLEDIKLFGQYLDESFYAFKEDQDLCWRARLRGWEIMYNPKAVAYHLRGWGQKRSRRTVPRFVRQHSFKNRYLLMLKNDHFSNWLIHLPYILLFELQSLIYMIFVEPHLIMGVVQFFKLLPFTIRKRREIMRRAVVGAKEMRRWFV